MKSTLFPFAVATLAVAFVGCSREPTNYDECILKNLTASMDRAVGGAIVEACRNKYAEKATLKEPLVELPPEAAEKLTGKFGVESYGGSGNIYNGNEKWRVEEVTILVAEPGWQKKAVAHSKNPETDEPHTERYKVKVSVPPLTSKDFTIDVNWRSEDKYEWFITDARGVEQP